MIVELIVGGIRIGTAERCGPMNVIVRLPSGEPLGQLGTIDAAVMALTARAEQAAATANAPRAA